MEVFYKIILVPWAVSTFLLTLGELKKQIAGELESVKRINEALGLQKFSDREDRFAANEMRPIGAGDKNEPDGIRIPLKEGIRKIAFHDIYFIAVEDHYCKFVINKNGVVHRELVRLSLKEALASLPPNLFAHVHRSYVVNLQHIEAIDRVNQTYQLSIKGVDELLPASRHRTHAFLPQLKNILRESY